MDADDNIPRRTDDILAALLAQDLDPMSIAELDARIIALEGEIARVRRHSDKAARHRDSADALFRR